jgi:hypothetical protein
MSVDYVYPDPYFPRSDKEYTIHLRSWVNDGIFLRCKASGACSLKRAYCYRYSGQVTGTGILHKSQVQGYLEVIRRQSMT